MYELNNNINNFIKYNIKNNIQNNIYNFSFPPYFSKVIKCKWI